MSGSDERVTAAHARYDEICEALGGEPADLRAQTALRMMAAWTSAAEIHAVAKAITEARSR